MQDAAGGALAADATIIAPYGSAFSIWSVIYTGLLAYAVWQVLPGQATRTRHRTLGWWILVSQLLNAAWILTVQAGLLGLSVAVIAALLVTLIVVFVGLQRSAASGWGDVITMDATMGLYLGWVMIATIANITAWLVASGFDGFGLPAPVWGAAVVAVGMVLVLGVTLWSKGRLAPAAAAAWGLAWIGVARLIDEPQSVVVAVAALGAAGVIVLVAIVARVVAERQQRATSHEASTQH